MYISVRVIAGVKDEGVETLAGGRLRVRVSAPAKQGLANRRALELVAAHLQIPVGKVRLISGHHSPSKIFAIPDKRQ